MPRTWTEPKRQMRWPEFHHVIFDCDSTLTSVEGIAVLAESADRTDEVEEHTAAAMNGAVPLEEVYRTRLDAVEPLRQHVTDIRRAYKRNAVADAATTVAALQDLGHAVYIVSGGLAEPVRDFAHHLGIPDENVYAVEMEYDELSGEWWSEPAAASTTGSQPYSGYEENQLTLSTGKMAVIREILGAGNGRSMLVGDGVSDLLAASAVDLFVGFGGVARRDRVVAEADAYLSSSSLAPILPIAAGPQGRNRLTRPEHMSTFQRGIDLIESGAVRFRDAARGEQLAAALESGE